MFKSCPRNQQDPTDTAILLDGGFLLFELLPRLKKEKFDSRHFNA